MADNFGSDYITIVDEDGEEFELEVLMSMEYNGSTYQAVIPAVDSAEEIDLEISILKNVEEDGEIILCAIEDEQELETVYNLMMDALYEEEEDAMYYDQEGLYCLVDGSITIKNVNGKISVVVDAVNSYDMSVKLYYNAESTAVENIDLFISVFKSFCFLIFLVLTISGKNLSWASRYSLMRPLPDSTMNMSSTILSVFVNSSR